MKHNIEISSIVRKRTLGLLFILGAASFAFAQEKASVSGKVTDADNQSVPYASVTFSNKANKAFSDATLTDDQGNYTLDLAPGNYDITIEAINYRKTLLSNRQLPIQGSLNLKIDRDATASPGVQTKDIQGVVITAAAAKPYKVEIDKKVYDPSADLTSKGGNLQDVLSNVPSVTVDTDGTVSMRGSSNVRFLINGKPSALLGIDDGANALQSIPAEQIERIEVITNPSSKFEASGTAGILNIILKKTKKLGFNGSVTGSVGYQQRTNLNANLSWKKGGLTWFLNGGGGYSQAEMKNENSVIYNKGAYLNTSQNTLNKIEMNTYNATAGLVYDFSDRTSMNLSGTVRTFDNLNNATVNYLYNYRNGTDVNSQRLSSGHSTNLAFQTDLGFDHKINDNGQNISASLSWQHGNSPSDTNILETNTSVFVLNDLLRQKTTNKSIIGKLDYELPINENSKIEAGYRLDANNNLYDNAVNTSKDGYLFNQLERFTNSTDYKEMINAAFVQFQSKVGKFGYQLGLRDEFSNIDINYKNLTGKDNFIKEKNYNQLFPSVFLSYDLEKDNQLLLNYSRRIDRPRSFFLVPFMSYSDPRNLFLGNADLNPSYINSFELGYSIQKKKFTINPTLYYRKTEDDVKMLVYRPDARTDEFITRPINLGTDTRYGLDLNATADVTSWLKLMANLDLFGYKNDGELFYDAINETGATQQYKRSLAGEGFSTRARLASTFKIDKTFSVQIQGMYRAGQKTAQQELKDMYALNLGASKTIWKGNGTLAFNVQDIFNTRNRTVFTYDPEYTRRSYMQFMPRQFTLSLTYRFKEGEKVEPKKKPQKDINNNYNNEDQQGPI